MKFTIYRHLITYKNQVLVYQYYIICFLYIAKTLNLDKSSFGMSPTHLTAANFWLPKLTNTTYLR